MQEYRIAVKVEVDEIYSVVASNEEDALKKFEDGEFEEVSLHDNAITIEEPRIVD